MSVLNDGVFKICAQPKSEESLTSFIMRMSTLNGCEAKDVWKEVSYSNEKSTSHIKFSRFDYDLHIFDRKRLAFLLGVTKKELDDMTSIKFFLKFLVIRIKSLIQLLLCFVIFFKPRYGKYVLYV